MEPGRDYNETFAPVAKLTTIRLLFAIATEGDFEIKQGDVTTAFITTDIDTVIYVKLPDGFQDYTDIIESMKHNGDTDSASYVQNIRKTKPKYAKTHTVFTRV